ncbi:hypothetical protein [Ralstonia mannitolilytica]|uniref:hypothetical protein n=1 Tax=Ralstonia mannitolilytica TaxID=105219 RepID=UPI001C97F4E2|nr:hypothetical protein [Ralstonia mannitolilytica]MBY4717563.1 hypothetical protein [Ralstonia mannitolilytica]
MWKLPVQEDTFKILGDSKISHFVDKNGRHAYMSGLEVKGNIATPRSFKEIAFITRSQTQGQIAIDAVNYVRDTLEGHFALRGLAQTSVDDIALRFLSNIPKVKAIQVEKIEFVENRWQVVFAYPQHKAM